jgi:dipeptidyl aminopeptidase/acylaminoacyl peptidase
LNSKILNRQIIQLNDHQNKLIKSGWGSDILDKTNVERMSYLSGGLKINGYIAYPQDSSKKYPCIIWNRGGSNEEGAIDSFTARGIFGQIASWGYVVFASQYRGNAGSEGKEQLGGDDVNDILNLIPLADEIPLADKSIWGIEGWSRGGMMTYLILSKNSNFKCAILSGAISDLKQFIGTRIEKMNYYKEMINSLNFDEELEKRSAINFVESLPEIPYLLLHGGNDKTVSPVQTLNMSKKMNDLNIPYRLIIFEDGDHFLKNHRKEVDKLRKFWFDKYLKTNSPSG